MGFAESPLRSLISGALPCYVAYIASLNLEPSDVISDDLAGLPVAVTWNVANENTLLICRNFAKSTCIAKPLSTQLLFNIVTCSERN